MAKKSVAEKPSANTAEDSFVNLMVVAANFVKSRGGVDAAKQALADAGQFIAHAGGVSQAARALEVLESLREKIAT